MPLRSDQMDSKSPEELLAVLDSETDPPPRDLVRQFAAALDALQSQYPDDRTQISTVVAGAWQQLASGGRSVTALTIARDLAAAAAVARPAVPLREAAASYVTTVLRRREP